MPDTVAILGCGPAGLLTAHAVARAGKIPYILSKKEQSIISGAQYLHSAIPDLTEDDPEVQIDFRKRGTAEGYALKVYGSADAPTSWYKFEEGTHPGWWLRPVYEKLWERYESSIVHHEVKADEIPILLHNYMMVISTIPLPLVCSRPDEHEFRSQNIWIMQASPPNNFGRDVIVYNGEPLVGIDVEDWYRYSELSGWRSWEYTHDPRSADDLDLPVIQGIKPTTNTCDCYQGRLMRSGRFGQWRKGCLLHHAFSCAERAIETFPRVPAEVSHAL